MAKKTKVMVEDYSEGLSKFQVQNYSTSNSETSQGLADRFNNRADNNERELGLTRDNMRVYHAIEE